MARNVKNKVVVIGGPTASGKSAVALDVAQEFGGIIINADSMQIYEGLHILTARPDPEDEALIEHRLYGIMDPSETCSAGLWERLCIKEIERCWQADRLPIVCGGTGLYIKALVEGLSRLPEIPEDIRQTVRRRADTEGIDSLYQDLKDKDPEMAARLKPLDRQRICRALEVLLATGTSLAEHQRINQPEPKLNAHYDTHILIPERKTLYKRCDLRFEQMVDQGALAEVRAFAHRNLPKDVPAMKALGLKELMAFLKGDMPLEQAIAEAQQQTRRFAKRQCTWFKNQISSGKIHSAQYSESLRDEIYKKVRQFLLTAPD